ncbi:hypothetical protein CVT24_000292 [Panaeolus cyanescens]|uniref:PAN2-PAN3 deadenylation complex subunit PAN3 n=1 Tax=Panaeolus cyanescens TaxID=181874 RepID=A0A409VWB1_9AGAR|nr:hypothetical protein CVT24_000292 [Panaeolus cyanescens]
MPSFDGPQNLNYPLSFLESPIETLTESIQDPVHESITVHDLIDAYNLFSTRLRHILPIIVNSDISPLLSPLQNNSAIVTDAICRDVTCVLPSSFATQQESDPELPYFEDDSSDSIDEPEDETDTSLLCCQALRMAADVCAIPCVMACLTDLERSRLISAVFEVSRFPTNVIFNWDKINSLVVSLFKFQQLPWDTMRTHQREIGILVRERVLDLSPQHRADSALILRHLLLRYPKLIKTLADQFLPTVLEQIVDTSARARIQAASALAAFALLKVKPDFHGYPDKAIHQAMQDFITKYTSRYRSLHVSNRLSNILKSAIAEDEFWEGKGMVFGISLMSSMVVILDHHIFWNGRALLAIFKALKTLSIHPKSQVRRAHSEIWRLLIWSLSKFSPSLDADEPIAFNFEKWDQAFQSIRAELKEGLGLQLIHLLMKMVEDVENEELSKNFVQNVISVLEDMSKHADLHIRMDAFKALCALLKGMGIHFSFVNASLSRSTTHTDIAFSMKLVDGSILELDSVYEANIPPTLVDVSIFKPLSEQDITDYWEKLAEVWAAVANDVVMGKQKFTTDYIRAWQALLLVQTQLTQGNEHLSPTPDFATKLASIVSGFAVSNEPPEIQAKALSFVSKLWNAMKNTFAHDWLSSAAEIIVTSLLSKSFSLDDAVVQEVWAKVCSDLIAVGVSSVLNLLHGLHGGDQEGGQMKRALWCLLAKSGKLPCEENDWRGMVQFLLMPFGAWELSDEDFNLWQTVFQKTLDMAQACGQTPDDVVGYLCHALNEHSHQGLSQCIKAVGCIVSQATYPNLELMRLVNEALVLHYAPVQESKTRSISMLSALGTMANAVEPSSVTSFLEDIQNSALIWLRDGDGILSENEQKDLMRNFYGPCLYALSKDVPSLDTLERLGPLIFSCFEHTHRDALRPFGEFWRATYHQHPTIRPEQYNQKIRIYLKAWHDVFDDSLGYSLDSNSIAHNSSPRDSRVHPSPGGVQEIVDSTFFFEEEPSAAILEARVNGHNRSGSVTPTPSQSRMRHIDKTVSERRSALDARIRELEEETSQDDYPAESQSSVKDNWWNEPPSKASKRKEEEQEISPAPKRRRMNIEPIPFLLSKPNASTSRSVPVTRQGSMSRERSSRQSMSPSNTTTTPSWLRSQNNMTHAMTRIGAVGDVSEVQPKGTHAPLDDYDSWEQPMSSEHLREVKAEMASSDDIVPDSEEGMSEDEERFSSKYAHDADGEGDGQLQLQSPISSQELFRSRRRERSQTAPEPGLMLSAQVGDSPDRQALRRNHTAGPFENKKTTSAQQLEVLHATYAALSSARESQMDEDDIIKAKEVTSSINNLLEQRILAIAKAGSFLHRRLCWPADRRVFTISTDYYMAFYSKPPSAAVRIVKPTSEEQSLKSTPTPRKDSVQRQCRNIVIYGHCKFQDKGCTYYHPPPPEAAPPPPSATAVSATTTRSESPAVAALTPQAVNAPVFVPKSATAIAVSVASTRSPPVPPPSVLTEALNTAGAQLEQDVLDDDNSLQTRHEYQNGHGDYSYTQYSDYYNEDQSVEGLQDLSIADPSSYYDAGQTGEYVGYEHEVADSRYYPGPIFLRQPLNYLMYTPATPAEQIRNTTNSHFVPPSADLRQLLQERSETIRSAPPVGLALPEELQGYHTLVPLEPTGSGVERRKIGNWYSTVYRAIKASDGVPYALRRIEGYRLMQPSAFEPIKIWESIQHPSIVSVREAFTTKAFNDDSLVVVYTYHPNSKTLYDAHLKPKPPASSKGSSTVYYGRHGRQQQQQQQAQHYTISERTLWTYIVQIASAIKRVHDRGLAVRMIDVTKILVTGQHRSCGIIDVLLHDAQEQDISLLQQEDLLMFGKLIFVLMTGNVSATTPHHFQQSLETMRSRSPDLQALVTTLMNSQGPKTIDQVLDQIRPQILAEQDEALMATDRLENELLGELENARLVRLLCKFGFINERPEFSHDLRWSETGDRYIIKLFRDYVFHQVDSHGNPVLNLAHVLSCLNKLDAGTDEQIMLTARDEQSCLVVSYKEIKACMSSAFNDLTMASSASHSNGFKS